MSKQKVGRTGVALGRSSRTMGVTRILGAILFSFALYSAGATTWYVDSSVGTSGNGTSWGTAWKALSNVTGVKAGDTVYLSGGASGSSQTYSVSSWKPTGGAAGNPITYQIGQDSAHNGTAVFSGSGTWFGGASYAIISGDAGNGAMHFSLSGYSAGVNNNGTVNLRISYVNMGNGLGDGVDGQSVTAFEFDHNYCYIVGTVDHFLSCGFSDAAFDGTKIHDNTIFVPKQAQSANGADAFQIAGSGWSIYNNTIQAYNMSWSGAVVQHQDGIQTLIGSDIKIYGNVFANLANTSVFMDGYYGAFNHIYIYNNVCQTTSSADNNGPGGIEVGADGGPAVAPSFNDVIVANNDMIDQNPYNGTCIAFGNCPSCNGGNSTPYTACYMVNNIAINSGSMTTYNSPINTSGNVTLTTAQGQAYFASYIPLSANNNYHLTAAATALIGKGANESTYFTTDKGGNGRPATGNWDVGAYQYASGSTNPPPTTNYTISASAGTGGTISPSGSVLVNSGSSQTFTITPSSGYLISSVTVDSVNVGAVSTYTCSSVVTNHTISANFSAAAGVTAPTNLSASPVSASEIDLSWTASTAGTDTIAGYHIYVNGVTTPTASVTTTSYQSTGLSAAASYSYAVTAYTTAGNESQRSTNSATTWPPLSTKFSLNQQVQVLATANIRQQPANEQAGAIIGQQPVNALATVVGGPVYAEINGVYYYWWNLSFSTSPSGWVAEDNLQAGLVVNPAIQATPGTMSYGSVSTGTSMTNSFTVQNVGQGMLSGTASVGAPFSVISGGSYNLGAGQSQTVTVAFSPTVVSNYSQSVSFSGGGGTNATVSGSLSMLQSTVQLQVTPVGQVVLTVTGQNSHTYDIQATQDFNTWTVIGTVTMGASGTLDFTDTNAVSFANRFYRTRE